MIDLRHAGFQVRVLSLEKQIDYWIGRFVLAIGRGKLRDEVSLMIQYYCQEGKHDA